MNLLNKKLIIFDLDGTLVDSVPDIAASVNHMLKTIGKNEVDINIIRGWVGNGVDVLVKRALSNSVQIDKNLDKEYYKSSLEIFMEYYKQNSCVRTVMFENVKDTLKALKQKGYILTIVTNKPYIYVPPILKTLNIEELFSMVLGADSLEKKKPDPMPLEHICKELNIDIKEAVMVGDSKNDILPANSINMDSIGVTYGYNYGEHISKYDPTVCIDDFSEMLSVLGE